jgi:hypothetical protein
MTRTMLPAHSRPFLGSVAVSITWEDISGPPRPSLPRTEGRNTHFMPGYQMPGTSRYRTRWAYSV